MKITCVCRISLNDTVRSPCLPHTHAPRLNRKPIFQFNFCQGFFFVAFSLLHLNKAYSRSSQWHLKWVKAVNKRIWPCEDLESVLLSCESEKGNVHWGSTGIVFLVENFHQHHAYSPQEQLWVENEHIHLVRKFKWPQHSVHDNSNHLFRMIQPASYRLVGYKHVHV